MGKLEHYGVLADLFRYPQEGFVKSVENVRKVLQVTHPEAAAEIKFFKSHLPQKDLDKLQALFTRTFDIQAITTLDVAYVLFGDDYKRGEILANLNREHLKAQNDCGVELSDHLPNLLTLISKLEDEDLLQELIHIILGPALLKMLKEFNPENVDQKNKLYKKHYKTLLETIGENSLIYEHALQALYLVLQKDFDVKEQKVNDFMTDDFLKSVSDEMDIEKIANE